MNSHRDPPVFPYQIFWEEFAPSQGVTWEGLEQNFDEYEALFRLGEIGGEKLPVVNEAVLEDVVERILGQAPTAALTSKLYLLAGWQATGAFRKQIGMDLIGQRPAIKRLQLAAFELWQASNRVSGHVAALLPWLHAVEPDRLMADDHELDIHDLGRAAYDVSLVAARAYEDTRPKQTGRMPEFRRDTTVRLGAEAIEAGTGEPITISRGNKAHPQRHFTNAGGRLLREFFRLVEPKTDESLLVQSFARVRRRKNTAKKL